MTDQWVREQIPATPAESRISDDVPAALQDSLSGLWQYRAVTVIATAPVAAVPVFSCCKGEPFPAFWVHLCRYPMGEAGSRGVEARLGFVLCSQVNQRCGNRVHL